MDGYCYTRMLKQKIAEDLDQRLNLQDAIEYIRFYGIRGILDAQGDIQFVGQAAIDALDRGLSADIGTISWDDIEGTIYAYTENEDSNG